MEKIVRPDDMQRITTQELAEKFISEQIAEVKAQVGDKKVLLALLISAIFANSVAAYLSYFVQVGDLNNKVSEIIIH